MLAYYRIIAIPTAIALASILASCQALPVSEELVSEEDFSVEDRSNKTWNSVESANMSIYARKFRCTGVKRVGLKSF